MKETKHITEGAALLGIYVLLLLMTLFIPFIGLITFLALVVPFVVYTARNGWKSGIWLVVVAGVLSVLIGSPVALALSIPASTAGVVIGHLVQKNTSRYAILGAATGVFLLNYILAYVVAIVLFDIDFIEVMQEMIRESIQASEAIATSLGQENAKEAVAILEESLGYTSYLLPTMLVLTSFVHAYFSQLITFFIIKRLKMKISPFPPFRELVLPKSLLWYYLIVLILSLMAPEEGTTLFMVVLNLSFILMLLMTVQGFSFIFYFCHIKKISKAIPITLVILSFLITPLVYIIRMIGIIDIGFQLRERIQGKNQGK
ncbi:YybS family protein [Sutcliffiella horikoshii]|uniref:YybS family protein n=1 Tax=Sutcliffiella horikoshii TaxID=79883 RepID=UPI001CFEE3C4|nr:YybS family protein [Sutcliffiella horikoshii]